MIKIYMIDKKEELKKALDYLHELFPVPDHNLFEMMPNSVQQRIIGQGEVMSELVKYYEK